MSDREGDSSGRSDTSSDDQYELFARHYDLWLEGYEDDLAMYQRLARESGGRVLVAMCGTGRVVRHLADRGHDVVGVDRSSSMLDMLTTRLEMMDDEVRDRIDLVHDDVRDVQAEGEFGLVVVPHNTFLHIITHEDQVRAMGNLASHLSPGGRLVISVFNPDLGRRDGSLVHLGTRVNRKGETVSRFESQDVDVARQTMRVHHFYDVSRQGGPLSRITVSFDIVYLTLRDLEDLVSGSGLVIEGVHGDYDSTPFKSGTDTMVIVARRP